MKKRIFALVLALIMVFSMTACGGKNGEDEQIKTLAHELGFGYLAQYSDLNAELNWINTVSSAQGMLYFYGDYYNEETYESATKLYCVNPDTGETSEIPVPAMNNSEGVSEYIQSISVCADGSGYWMLMERYTYEPYVDEDGDGIMPLIEEAVPYDVPAEEEMPEEEVDTEEVAEEDAGVAADYEVQMLSSVAVAVPAVEEVYVEDDFYSEDMIYEEPQSQYFAKKLDMSGNILLELDLTEVTKELDYFYPQAVAQNAQGDLVIASDDKIFLFGSDGNAKDTIELDGQWIQYMATTGNGTVVASFYDYENGSMVACRVEDGALSEPLNITGFPETGNMMLYSGDGDTLLINDGTYLYSLDVNTGVATKMLSWLDSDINGGSLNGIVASGADKVMVLVANYSNDGMTEYELGILTKTPVEQIPERTILTLGAIYLDDILRNAVIDFNRSNETYRITLIDYSVYNTTEDYSLASQQLDRDVVSGNCPDIVSLTTGHEDKYISKGALADLTTFFEKDETVSLDDLLSGPLQAYTVDGKLYGLPTSFYVQTMLASKKLVGDLDSWTMTELGQIIQNLDDSVTVMDYCDQSSFLTQMVYQNLEQFVDYGKATCSFNGQEFKDLMQVSSYLPTTEEYEASIEAENEAMENGTYMYYDTYQKVQAGEQLLVSEYISGTYSVKYLYNLYTEENGFAKLGYPQAGGNGALLGVDGGLAISATGKNQDGAWEFVKALLSDEVQEDVWNFPIKISAFDETMAELMERSYYMEGDEKVYYDDYGYIGDTEYILEPLTQAQLDDFKVFVNGATTSGNYDEEIITIITEEVGAYFSGDKSVDEVADLIQNRVTIYLGETS